jgi:hypothetical protein
MCRPRRGIPHTPTTCASRRLLTWSMFGPFLQMPKYLGAVHGATRPRNSRAPPWDKRQQAKGSVGRISKEGIWLQRKEGAREIDSPEKWILWRSGFPREMDSLGERRALEKGGRWRKEGTGGHVADARGPLVKPPSRITWIGLIQNGLDFWSSFRSFDSPSHPIKRWRAVPLQYQGTAASVVLRLPSQNLPLALAHAITVSPVFQSPSNPCSPSHYSAKTFADACILELACRYVVSGPGGMLRLRGRRFPSCPVFSRLIYCMRHFLCLTA